MSVASILDPLPQTLYCFLSLASFSLTLLSVQGKNVCKWVPWTIGTLINKTVSLRLWRRKKAKRARGKLAEYFITHQRHHYFYTLPPLPMNTSPLTTLVPSVSHAPILVFNMSAPSSPLLHGNQSFIQYYDLAPDDESCSNLPLDCFLNNCFQHQDTFVVSLDLSTYFLENKNNFCVSWCKKYHFACCCFLTRSFNFQFNFISIVQYHKNNSLFELHAHNFTEAEGRL